MRSVKWAMFNFHFWCGLQDWGVSFLTVPYILWPAFAGIPMGLFSKLGLKPVFQSYLVMSFVALSAVAILTIFEHRFYLLFAKNTRWRYYRIPYLASLYLFASTIYVHFGLNKPDQDDARRQVLQILPTLPSYINENEIFVFTLDAQLLTVFTAIALLLVGGGIALFSGLLYHNMHKRLNRMQLSRNSFRMQQKFLTSVKIQISTPLLLLIAPCAYVGSSSWFVYYNQTFNNFCVIIVSSHGILSTIMMICMHKPYREFCHGLIHSEQSTSPSLAPPRKTTSRKTESKVIEFSTPEKITELESKIQTRGVAKSLSALKESVTKKEREEVGKKPKLAPILEKAEKKSARKSLANVLKTETTSSSRNSSIGADCDLKMLTGIERIKAAREQSSKQARLSTQKRMSLSAVGKSPKREPQTKELEKETIPDPVVTTMENPIESEALEEEEDLNRTFVIDDDDEIVSRRFNTWCLDHETSKEAWLSDDIIFWYLKHLCAKSTKYETLDPIMWEMYKREGIMLIKQKLWSTKTYFFPVCENNHWILLVISLTGIWYANSFLREPEGKVQQFIEELGTERKKFDTPNPCQTDGINCGVHVCLMAKSCLNDDYWYTEKEVQSFRKDVKKMLRANGYDLYSEQYRDFHQTDETTKKPESPEKVDTSEVSVESPMDIPHVGQPEEVDRVSIPKLMDLKLECPPHLLQKVAPKVVKPKEKPTKQMGKARKVPTGKPEELVVKDGRSFQRLEWITDVLTAAIQKGLCWGHPGNREDCEKDAHPWKWKRGNSNPTGDGDSRKGPPVSQRDSYWQNRTKTFNQLIGKESKQCEIPISQLEQFFKENHLCHKCNKKRFWNQKKFQNPKDKKVGQWIVDPFTEQELAVALKKTKDTAPGVDGLRYHHLEWFDPDHRILTPLYNECKEHRKIPSHWKEAETILLYKGGDESKPENWRPISLMPTIYKLYSSLWNRRIRSVKGVMSKCQRGFQEREGCNESIGILRTAIDVAKGRKKRTCQSPGSTLPMRSVQCHMSSSSTLWKSCTFGLPKKITERHDAVLMKVKNSSKLVQRKTGN
ncbi:unnamed protein product [Caenorhabditis sp. 36 PRJEB53466]|nr:unnamed protein product [Caenorhabditis sp. 36 PRJEB53466]